MEIFRKIEALKKTMKRINEAEAAEILKSKDNILILTHRSPDGDTLGCALRSDAFSPGWANGYG